MKLSTENLFIRLNVFGVIGIGAVILGVWLWNGWFVDIFKQKGRRGGIKHLSFGQVRARLCLRSDAFNRGAALAGADEEGSDDDGSFLHL